MSKLFWLSNSLHLKTIVHLLNVKVLIRYIPLNFRQHEAFLCWGSFLDMPSTHSNESLAEMIMRHLRLHNCVSDTVALTLALQKFAPGDICASDTCASETWKLKENKECYGTNNICETNNICTFTHGVSVSAQK